MRNKNFVTDEFFIGNEHEEVIATQECHKTNGIRKARDVDTVGLVAIHFNLLVCFFVSHDLSAPTHSKCRGLSLHFVRLHDTPHSVGVLNEGSARRRNLCEQHIPIRNRKPYPRRVSNPQSQQADGRRPHGRRDQSF